MEPQQQGRRRDRENGEDNLSWSEWKQQVFEAIEALDRSCAEARQVIYRLRPLVRSRTDENGSVRHQQRQVAAYNDRRKRERRDR